MSHYVTLGVHKGSTEEEIKEAYRGIAKENHPDLTNNDPAKAAVMADANIAYGIVGDTKKRKTYNANQRAKFGECNQCEGKGFTFKQKGFSKKITVACSKCEGTGTRKKS